MKNLSLLLAVLTLCANAHAYDISDYYPTNSGATSVFDRDVFTFDGTEHTFGTEVGKRIVMASTTSSKSFSYVTDKTEGIVTVGLYNSETDTYTDLSSYNLLTIPSNLAVNQSITSTLPAEAVGMEQQLTTTYLGMEDVTVISGTYTDCVKIQIDMTNGEIGSFREIIWLARDKGIVKVERVSESDMDGSPYRGCFYACGCWDDSGQLVTRILSGTAQSAGSSGGSSKVVVVPLF